jgi:hypothetical protein
VKGEIHVQDLLRLLFNRQFMVHTPGASSLSFSQLERQQPYPPPTVLAVGGVFLGMRLGVFGYRLYKKWHRGNGGSDDDDDDKPNETQSLIKKVSVS